MLLTHQPRISTVKILVNTLSIFLHEFFKKIFFQNGIRDFPGGAVVKNPIANAGDMGSSPGPGRSHVPQSN